MAAATLTLTLTPAEQAAVLEALNRVRQADAELERGEPAKVIPLNPMTAVNT